MSKEHYTKQAMQVCTKTYIVFFFIIKFTCRQFLTYIINMFHNPLPESVIIYVRFSSLSLSPPSVFSTHKYALHHKHVRKKMYTSTQLCPEVFCLIHCTFHFFVSITDFVPTLSLTAFFFFFYVSRILNNSVHS